MDIREEKELIKRAEHLLKISKGILYRGSVGIIEHGLKLAKKLNDFSDLKEFLPIIERKYLRLKKKYEEDRQEKERVNNLQINLLYKSYTKEMLLNQLEKCQKESLRLMERWLALRRDERTQRKATISNRAGANAKEMILIQDALTYMKINKLKQI